MKRAFLYLITAALLLASCDKEDYPAPSGNEGAPMDTLHVDPPDTTFNDGLIINAVVDYDGNTYDAVRLGHQIWMASNLRTTHYAKGQEIPVGDTHEQDSLPFCYPPHENAALFGYYYNWIAAMDGCNSTNNNPSGVQGVCPDGWHLPSDAEWVELLTYIGSRSEYVCSGNAANTGKALATDYGWVGSNGSNLCNVGYYVNENNATGFSGYPAGECFPGLSIVYQELGMETYFWTTTKNENIPFGYDICSRTIMCDQSIVGQSYSRPGWYYSVRCLKN